MLADFHMHTKYSYDAEPDSVEATCLSAIEKGLQVIALVDHKDFFRQKPSDPLDVAARQADIRACQEKFQDQIEILCSVEIGQPFAAPQESADFLRENDFDFIIGAVHAMPNDVDMYFLDYDHMDLDRFLQDYFDEVDQMIQWGGYDTLAHLDYPLRVMKRETNHPTFAGCMDRVDHVLKTLIRRDIALEINTKGLFGWQKSPGPEDFVLRRYRELGGRLLTVGSDSHQAAKAGRGFEEGMAYAKSMGFDSVTGYRNHKPYEIAL